MGERVSPRRRPRRKVLCRSDGSMFDVAQRRRISMEELRDHLLDGGLFEAETEESGRDCTHEVLRRLMGNPVDAGAGGMNPLGALGMFGGALGGLGEVAGLARLVGARSEVWDREEPPARTRTRARSRAAWDTEVEEPADGQP